MNTPTDFNLKSESFKEMLLKNRTLLYPLREYFIVIVLPYDHKLISLEMYIIFLSVKF